MLNGIRVLDVGGWAAGPVACGFLGSLGADVIRFEPPQIEGPYYFGTLQSGVSTSYIFAHFNARNVIIDLKSDEGRKLGFRLVETADVLVENHRTGLMDRLGFGYEDVRKVNPRIIYCASSGYGREGPLAKSPSNDVLMQVGSGFASIQGSPGTKGEVFRFGVHIDYTTSLTIVQGVLMALLHREITGEGQKLETSQFEAALSMQASRICEYFASGVNPEPMGTANRNIVPSQAFKGYDGKYFNVSVSREEYWPKLCKALELAEIENDPRFATNEQRVKNREQLISILEKKFEQEPARWWLILLPRHGIPCGPYNTVDEILNDPHVRAKKMLKVLNTPWGKSIYATCPVKFGGSPGATQTKATVKPDNNRKEILTELDYK